MLRRGIHAVMKSLVSSGAIRRSLCQFVSAYPGSCNYQTFLKGNPSTLQRARLQTCMTGLAAKHSCAEFSTCMGYRLLLEMHLYHFGQYTYSFLS